jgi:PAT family beta-lactamase induction signal transducer AmpG
VWTGSTYFAEGFPYSLVHNMVEVLFTELGASLQAIGLTSLLHLPYNVKFLWAPLVDRYGEKRHWIVGTELLMVGVMLALAVVVPLQPMALLSALFLVLAAASATQDIAVDGYYLDALDEKDQARFVGVRAPLYRAALLVAGGPMLVFVGVAGWPAGFAACAAVMVALALFHGRALPPAARGPAPLGDLLRRPASFAVVAGVLGALAIIATLEGRGGEEGRVGEGVTALVSWIPIILAALVALSLVLRPAIVRRLARSEGTFATAFHSFLTQPKVVQILAFVVLFRVGESFLQKMRYPFLKSAGMTLEQYGLAKGTLGMIASLVAPAIGGYLIARGGLRRWVWPFVLAQNLLNLLYAWLALHAGGGDVELWLATLVITTEMFGAGLGTAVFMVFIMRCCQPAHRASHMAILTAIMSIGYTVAGSLSGFVADAVGYPTYFALTFVATIPGMLLLIGLPHLDASSSSEGR